ncbi:MAG TPA: DUF5777 family beta-barrel protein [Chitinophagaceae bacterium]|nr:DUF5777 family beta-barrel protein [Chitinophagaceae bacterium]
MKQKAYVLLLLIFCSAINVLAQDSTTTDLLKDIEEAKPTKEYASSAFKSSRVIMSHSIEMLKPGTMDFRILHRFGNVNRGISELFGLDNANGIRLGLDYGVTKDFSVGIGRSSIQKELDGFLKYRIAQQAIGDKGLPFSLVVAAGSTITTQKLNDFIRINDSTTIPRKNLFSSRIGYYGQVLIGKRFSNALSIQIMPTFVHQNLVVRRADPNNTYAVGLGSRIKLSKRMAMTVDYYYVLNQLEGRSLHHPLSIGFDIETGGHVFQLHFSNALGMNERVFLTQTTNDWGKGDFGFGFNISRVFQIKKKKL